MAKAELAELIVADAEALRAWLTEISEFVAMLARHETIYPQKAKPSAPAE